ncbi:MAG: acylase [Gemmatimonadota bacterium]|jgi:acyl-homoserine-lactone acylase
MHGRRPPSGIVQLLLLLLIFAVLSCQRRTGTELLWDTYGVPHIFASDAESMFKAQGWAQMKAHGDLILRLYGQARGRAAEYWGQEYLSSDVDARTLGIPALAGEWARIQEPAMGGYLEAFVAGMNDYAEVHADAISDEVEVVLPVTTEDALAHLLRVIHFSFVASPTQVPRSLRASLLEETLGEGPPGSNAWAIGPSRSASGNALLLANPHLPWSDFFLWFENHLVGPDFDAYGATLVGMPLITVGFNDRLGWTHTVNTYDGSDLYELTLEGDGYLFDGEIREFESSTETLLVLREDGSLVERDLTILRSLHGPVLGTGGGKAYALRVAGLESAHVFRQYYDMLSATNLEEFEAAMAQLQMPMFTTMYADRDGHIMHLFNGLIPVRAQGDVAYWAGSIQGNTSETLWTEYHRYSDLPKAIDPESGWLQNANDPPWTTTFPQPAGMDPARYAAYTAPEFMHPRAQRSARMLMEDESITFDELVEYKHSTHMEAADRLLPGLVAAAREVGGEEVLAAAEVLESWDGNADVDSRGAVLFLEWAQNFWNRTRGNAFAIPWDPSDPMGTPAGLADAALALQVLAEASEAVGSRYGSLDVPFGDVYRVRRDNLDLPGNGMTGPAGVFRAAGYGPAEDGKYQIGGGDSFVLAVEFGDSIRAMAVTGYGNASQPGSSHRTDQLQLFSEKRMRPVWRTRREIEANLDSRIRWE